MVVNLKNSTNEMIRFVSFKAFLERGYEATNIRDICKEVNIKASSLYFYYKSKQELFFSLYDEVYSEKIEYIRGIEELKQDIPPNEKLYILNKKMIQYYANDIVKQKFLFRNYLFPPEEISTLIRDKLKTWMDQENKFIMNIVYECIDKGILDSNRHPNEYLLEYKNYENLQITDMIISNIKVSEEQLNKLWERFWNYTMLSI